MVELRPVVHIPEIKTLDYNFKPVVHNVLKLQKLTVLWNEGEIVPLLQQMPWTMCYVTA